ncbi:MAG: electron transport complex subunit RsxA, partial [Deltaproteobacteria bacterium]|nr:electron transport complex subunit RsxA [Deltaproteobacteria bacterium]
MTDYFMLIIAAIFINNIVLAQYLGNCPFLGTSKSIDVAVGMGAAVVFVSVMSAAITWPIQKYILEPWGLVFSQ